MRIILLIILIISLSSCNPVKRAQTKIEKLTTRYPELVNTKTVTRYDTVRFVEITKEDSIVLAMDETKFDSLLFEFIRIVHDIEMAYGKEPLEGEIINRELANLRRNYNNSTKDLSELKRQYDLLLWELRKGAFRDTTYYFEDEFGFLEINYVDGKVGFSYKVFERYKVVPVEESITTIDLNKRLTKTEILLLLLTFLIILNLIFARK